MSGERSRTQGPSVQPSEPAGPRRIFRPAAVERYVSRAMETVLPRFVAPRALVWLWLVAGLLLAVLLVLAVLLDGRTGTGAASWIAGSLPRA